MLLKHFMQQLPLKMKLNIVLVMNVHFRKIPYNFQVGSLYDFRDRNKADCIILQPFKANNLQLTRTPNTIHIGIIVM